MIVSIWRAVIVIAVITVTPAAALASPAAADKLIAEAAALASAGDHRGAAAKYTAAYKEDQRADLFCNIGISYYKAQDLARAHLVLGRCLERAALEAKFVDAARAVLASVETSLRQAGHTPVTVSVTPSATAVTIPELFPDEAFVGTRLVWLPFGTFKLSAHAEGYVDATVTVTTSTKEPQTATIVLKRPGDKPIGPTGPDGTTPIKPDPPPPPGRSRSKVPALLATGGTVIAAGIAVLGFVNGRSAAERAATALDDETFQADKDEVSKWNTALVIGSGLAIAGAGISGYLWYRATSSTESTVRVEATGGSASVSFGGRF